MNDFPYTINAECPICGTRRQVTIRNLADEASPAYCNAPGCFSTVH